MGPKVQGATQNYLLAWIQMSGRYGNVGPRSKCWIEIGMLDHDFPSRFPIQILDPGSWESWDPGSESWDPGASPWGPGASPGILERALGSWTFPGRPEADSLGGLEGRSPPTIRKGFVCSIYIYIYIFLYISIYFYISLGAGIALKG